MVIILLLCSDKAYTHISNCTSLGEFMVPKETTTWNYENDLINNPEYFILNVLYKINKDKSIDSVLAIYLIKKTYKK